MNGMPFHDRLIHALTDLDRRESRRAGYNPHALGLYFQAAEGVTDAVSFARAFCATRGMHRVARSLGLPLDVRSGTWICTMCDGSRTADGHWPCQRCKDFA